jgi:hypothetical protein
MAIRKVFVDIFSDSRYHRQTFSFKKNEAESVDPTPQFPGHHEKAPLHSVRVPGGCGDVFRQPIQSLLEHATATDESPPVRKMLPVDGNSIDRLFADLDSKIWL